MTRHKNNLKLIFTFSLVSSILSGVIVFFFATTNQLNKIPFFFPHSNSSSTPSATNTKIIKQILNFTNPSPNVPAPNPRPSVQTPSIDALKIAKDILQQVENKFTQFLATPTNSGLSLFTNENHLYLKNIDRGSAQKIFKHIAVDGQNTISAANNDDTLTLATSGNISITTDSNNQKITFEVNSESPDYSKSGWTDDGDVVRLTTSTDKVGIGTNSPSERLELNGNLYLNPGQLRLGNYASNPTSIGKGSIYYNTTNNQPYYYNGSNWTSLVSTPTSTFLDLTDTPSTYSHGQLLFMTSTNVTSSSDLFWDQTSSRLGIGTTLPTAKLHLQGATTGKALAIFNETGDQNIFTASASGNTKFVITHEGRVGIGITNPLTTLEVYSEFGTPSSDSTISDRQNGFYYKTIFTPTDSGLTGTAGGGIGVFQIDTPAGITTTAQDHWFSGFRSVVRKMGPGTVTEMIGIGGGWHWFNEGQVDNFYNLFATRLSQGSTGTGTVGNAYGVYIDGQKQDFVSNAYGIYQAGSNDINYFAGNVGIGTTDPGSIRLRIAGGDLAIDRDSHLGFRGDSGDAYGEYITSTSPAYDLRFYTANSARMTILNNGNIGIGTTTPTALLSVNSSGANPSIDNPTDGQGLILRAAGGGTYGQLRIVANGYAWSDNTTTSYFQIKNGLNNNVTFMGGTYAADTPISRLQFNSEYTTITDHTYTDTPVPTHLLEIINGTPNRGLLKLKAASAQTGNLFEWQDITGTSLGVINASGNLGLGTSSPTTLLHVQGATTGKALAIFNETGDQALLTASASGTTKFTLNNDGGFIAYGTYGSGNSLNVSGAGTRLIWYPQKAAFRAGSALYDEWDDTNIGDYSVAFGEGTKASGEGSFSFGSDSNALGAYSMAGGNGSYAESDYSLAFGSNTDAAALYAFAIGADSSAFGNYSLAFGNMAESDGAYSLAFGNNAYVANDSSLAFGNYADSEGLESIAIGSNSVANGNQSVAIGPGTDAEGYRTIVLGSYNDYDNSNYPDSWDANDPLLIIGNGADDTNPSTAITLLKNGNLGIGSTSPTELLQVGESGDGTVAVANAWNTFSDIRFKNHIRPIDHALDKVLQLEGVYYDWKNSNQHSIGFIAQQVQPILPEIVTQDKNGYLSLDYSRFTPVLVQALKEQNNLITDNTHQITHLNTTIFATPAPTATTSSAIDELKTQLAHISQSLTQTILNVVTQHIKTILASIKDKVVLAGEWAFDKLTAKEAKVQKLCVTNPNTNQETCLTQEQLQQLLQLLPSPSPTPTATPSATPSPTPSPTPTPSPSPTSTPSSSPTPNL